MQFIKWDFRRCTKLIKISRRYPGALTAGAVREARHGLLTQAGTLWNVSQSEIPSILTVLPATGDTAPCGVTG